MVLGQPLSVANRLLATQFGHQASAPAKIARMGIIHLIRHAEPLFDGSGRVCGSEFSNHVRLYNEAGIADLPKPVNIEGSIIVFASNLPRSIETARAMFPGVAVNTSREFREVPIPTGFPAWISLSFASMTLVARALWLIRLHCGTESPRQAKCRARRAIALLLQGLESAEKAALVGHGYMNRLIGRELCSLGWRRTGSSGYGYCSVQTYEL